jgi:hypothetical protein
VRERHDVPPEAQSDDGPFRPHERAHESQLVVEPRAMLPVGRGVGAAEQPEAVELTGGRGDVLPRDGPQVREADAARLELRLEGTEELGEGVLSPRPRGC